MFHGCGFCNPPLLLDAAANGCNFPEWRFENSTPPDDGKGVPLPCKPDSVHPACAKLDGHFSHPAEAERPACAECD